jgi:hypothetical protein
MTLSKDIQNLRQRLSRTGTSESEAESVHRVLEELVENGGDVRFAVKENEDLEYLGFMSQTMKEYASKFPELLVMDVTFRVTKSGYPLLNILCIDANGQGYPVYHGFLASECQSTIALALRHFSDCLEECGAEPVRTFFIDKDMVEKQALSDVFLAARIRLCAFHIMQAAKRALSKAKTSPELSKCLLMYFQQQRVASEERVRVRRSAAEDD